MDNLFSLQPQTRGGVRAQEMLLISQLLVRMSVSEDAVLHGLLFLAAQLQGAHWNLEGQSRSDGVQNIWTVMGRGRARLGTSCQIIPFCWTQPRSVTSRCGVTIHRPLPCWLGCGESPSPQLHLVKVLLWRLPVSCTLGSNDW